MRLHLTEFLFTCNDIFPGLGGLDVVICIEKRGLGERLFVFVATVGRCTMKRRGEKHLVVFGVPGRVGEPEAGDL